MIETKRVEIGGKKYVIRQLQRKVGLRTLTKLAQVLGPTLGGGIKGLSPDADVGQAISTRVGEMIAGVTSAISPEFMEELVDTFIDATELVTDGGQVPLRKVEAMAFVGDYGSMMQWLKAHIDFNYANFLGGLGLSGQQS